MSISRSSSSSESSDNFFVGYDKFIHDDKIRDDIATDKVDDYVKHLSIDWRTIKRMEQVRDECLAYLKEQRQSDYYQGIKEKIIAGEMVTMSEYYYFVLTTDNLQLVDLDLLECTERFFTFQNCEENLMLVKAVLHYQRAETDEEKKHWQQELADAICFDCVNGVRPLFLNLAGADISGADLTDRPREKRGERTNPHLNFADMSGTKLDGCNMFAFDIQYSDLTGASLAGVYGNRKGEHYGPIIYASIAKNACFDGIELTVGSCQDSDFSGSSFIDATLNWIGVTGSVFTGANFAGATINDLRDPRDISFRNANFIGANIKKVAFSSNDFNGARFINAELLHHPVELEKQLDSIIANLLANMDPSSRWAKEEIETIQDLVARDIERCVTEKFPSHVLRREFYDAAAQHRLFHNHAGLSEQLACGAKYAYNNTVGTLFNGCGKFYSDISAARYLEELRDHVDVSVRPGI